MDRGKKEALDRSTRELFQKIMQQCRLERKSHGRYSVRELAKQLGVTENFLSAVENGREFPSLNIFLKYLVVNSFDTTPLAQLLIADSGKSESDSAEHVSTLVKKLYSLDQSQVQFVEEQLRIAQDYGVRATPKRRRR